MLRFVTRFALACLVAVGASFSVAPVRAQSQPAIPDDVELIRDVEYGQGGGRALRLHIVRPKNPPRSSMPAVIYIHGGGWAGGSRDGGVPHAVQWARRGYFGATIEYRFSAEAKFPAQIEDCKCAVRFLRAKAEEYKIDPDRIGVFGHSAGGHLSALLGTTSELKQFEGEGGRREFSSRVQAVCNISGPTDFLGWGDEAHPAVRGLLGDYVSKKPELAAQASPVTHVGKNTSPFLIIHGDDDKIVPVEQAQALHAVLEKAGIESELLIVPGGGHHPFGPEVTQAMQEFFDRHLNPKK